MYYNSSKLQFVSIFMYLNFKTNNHNLMLFLYNTIFLLKKKIELNKFENSF